MRLGDLSETFGVDTLLSISLVASRDRMFSLTCVLSGWLREVRPVFGVFMYGVCLLESQGVRADLLLFPALEPERVDLPFPVNFASDGVDKPSAILQRIFKFSASVRLHGYQAQHGQKERLPKRLTRKRGASATLSFQSGQKW